MNKRRGTSGAGAIVRVFALAAAVTFGAAASRAPAAEDDLDALEQQAMGAAVAHVAPCVVGIRTVGGLERVHNVLFGEGPTTGLVIDPQGYIVSSAFNFVNKPASILVELADGKPRSAKLVATDHNRMIALLKIDAGRPLPTPDIAPEAEMRVGQWCIGVGRTFQADQPNICVGILQRHRTRVGQGPADRRRGLAEQLRRSADRHPRPRHGSDRSPLAPAGRRDRRLRVV